MAHASLSQDGFQCEGFWEVGRTILWSGVSSFLLAPPRSSQLVFSGSTLFVIRTSSCETTQASSYHCSWPRQAVLVSGSLTIWPSSGSAICIADPWSPSSSNEENSINSKLISHICKSCAMEYGSEQPFSCCSVAQSCLTLRDPMDCSTPGFPVLHHLLEFAQTHVHWVDDAIQPSHPLLPPALNLSQHQGLFQWSGSLHQVTKVLELQLQSFQWIIRTDFFRIDWFDLLAVQGTLKSLL